MGILNRIISPIIEHSVNSMEEDERQALFDRLIDRMLRDMSHDEVIELLDRVMPELLAQMTFQQKLKLIATLLPKMVNAEDMNALKDWIDNMPDGVTGPKPGETGAVSGEETDRPIGP